ncbi:MAG: GNAT family N-acetyltransferase [Pelosinus sp.]|nr:GNAT family N-acetyltransferase [Pelosinus sp.]
MREAIFNPSDVILKGIIESNLNHIKAFTCGNGSMDNFLQCEAYIACLEREASTTLVYYKEELVAYFTLQRAELKIQLDENVQQSRDGLSLARLAVDENFQGHGIGTYIIERIKEIAYMVNERFIQTDAVYEKWEWYQARGFEYVIEDEINPTNTDGLVYMLMDLYNEALIDKFFDE